MVDATGTTTCSYDRLYRPTNVTFPGSRAVGCSSDDDRRRTPLTYPGGTNQAPYAYDNANQLTSVTDWALAAVSYAYDDAAKMTAPSASPAAVRGTLNSPSNCALPARSATSGATPCPDR